MLEKAPTLGKVKIVLLGWSPGAPTPSCTATVVSAEKAPKGMTEGSIAEKALSLSMVDPCKGEVSLQPGLYHIKVVYTTALDKPEKWVKDVQVVAGETKILDVSFSLGVINFSSVCAICKAWFYKAGSTQPVGETKCLDQWFEISSGTYDVKYSLSKTMGIKSAETWRKGLIVEKGKSVNAAPF
jgi:hypothetical protein